MAQNCEYPGCANPMGTGKSHQITNVTGKGKIRVSVSLCDVCEGLYGTKDPPFMGWFAKRAASRAED